MGFFFPYEKHEYPTRPTHPLTGAPADFYFVGKDGVRQPRWNAGHRRKHDTALSWFTLPEVAKLIGKTRRRVHQLVVAGIIPARRLGRTYYVSGQFLLTLVKSRPDMGSLPQPIQETK